MKILLIILMAFALNVKCKAQEISGTPTWNEFFKQKKTQKKYLKRQIALLQLYLGYVKQGYNIAHSGLTLIGNIKDGKFKLDQTYLTSLKQVKPAIRNSSKAKAILRTCQSTSDRFTKLLSDTRQDDAFTTDEIKYVQKVHNAVLEDSNTSLDELSMILTQNEMEMKDDERLTRMDKIYTDVQEQYAFTMDFASTTDLLRLQRVKERHELKLSTNLYDF